MAVDVVGYSRVIGADEAGSVIARLHGDGAMTMVLIEQRTDIALELTGGRCLSAGV